MYGKQCLVNVFIIIIDVSVMNNTLINVLRLFITLQLGMGFVTDFCNVPQHVSVFESMN